jgi:hypothetical protein
VLDPHSVLGDSVPRPRPRRHGRHGHCRQDHVRHERETRRRQGRGGHHHGTGSDRIGRHLGRLGGHVLRHEFTKTRTTSERNELCPTHTRARTHYSRMSEHSVHSSHKHVRRSGRGELRRRCRRGVGSTMRQCCCCGRCRRGIWWCRPSGRGSAILVNFGLAIRRGLDAVVDRVVVVVQGALVAAHHFAPGASARCGHVSRCCIGWTM